MSRRREKVWLELEVEGSVLVCDRCGKASLESPSHIQKSGWDRSSALEAPWIATGWTNTLGWRAFGNADFCASCCVEIERFVGTAGQAHRAFRCSNCKAPCEPLSRRWRIVDGVWEHHCERMQGCVFPAEPVLEGGE